MTGRPRRCGWFDAVAVRHAARVSGSTELAVMLLDVLSGIDELKVAVAYELDGRRVDRAARRPARLRALPPGLRDPPRLDRGPIDGVRAMVRPPAAGQELRRVHRRAAGRPRRGSSPSAPTGGQTILLP